MSGKKERILNIIRKYEELEKDNLKMIGLFPLLTRYMN